MGIYDRDYYRPEQRGFSVRTPRSAVGVLIAINVAVWVINGLFMRDSNWLTANMAVQVNTLFQPWMWWKFLTYAFAHDPNSFGHIFSNMLVLFFLGPPVEQALGSREFTRFYLIAAVVAGVVWAAINKITGTGGAAVGASGAISGVVILFALTYPHEKILFFFVLPMPAWLFGVIVVALDMFGAFGRPDSGIAYSMHLTGAAFAFIYFHQRWNFGRLLGGGFSWARLRSPFRPRLRVHQPEEREAAPPALNADLAQEVDRILEKIYREGEASLTAKERHTLETASRRYQQRR